MAATRTRRPPTALYVLAHAWYETKPRTAEEAASCSAGMARARDFLMHEPARSIAVAGVNVTEQEFEEARQEAVAEMRARCRTCGLCAEFGLKPP